MSIERAEVVARLRAWIEGKRMAAYCGVWGEGGARSALSLSRAPFERYCDAYVPMIDPAGARPRIVRVELDGCKLLEGQGVEVDGLPNVIREIIDAWAYWLADPEFSPADECLFVSAKSCA